MEISDLIPVNVKIKLSLIGEIEIQSCKLGTYLEIENKIGNIEKILQTPSLKNMCKIGFLLLTSDSKKKFKKIDKVDYDLDGNEIKVSYGGYKSLMNSILNVNEQVEFYKAIIKSMGFKEEVFSVEENKKKAKKVKKTKKK